MLERFHDQLPISISLLDLLDILIVAFIIYQILLLFQGTRAIQILKGLVVLILLFFVSVQLNLTMMKWILNNFWTVGVVALIIIFQAELKGALARVGAGSVFKKSLFNPKEELVKKLVAAARRLSQEKTGALIVLERSTGLKDYIKTGINLDAEISVELLLSIFNRTSPLHDGAVIISNERMASCCCLLPLTQNPDLSLDLGTRHRAAIGLSEETDALSITISEERGEISLALSGKISKDIDLETLEEMLILYES